MQFRFRKQKDNDDNFDYDLITIINIDDYYEMYKTLLFMKENNIEDSIELNTENLVDTIGDTFKVENISLCISEIFGEDALIPHFVVDLNTT